MAVKTKYRTRKKLQKRTRISITVIVVIGVFLLSNYANTWFQYRHVQEVSIYGCDSLIKNEIEQIAAKYDTTQIKNINLLQLKESIERIEMVETASVGINPPASLQIRVKQRTPYMYCIDTAKNIVVDYDGFIMPAAQSGCDSSLVVLTYDGIIRKNKTQSKIRNGSIYTALHLLRSLEQSNHAAQRGISEVHIRRDGNIILYTTKNRLPIICGKGDEEQISINNLKAYFRSIESHNKDRAALYVDVRFKDQIILGTSTEPASNIGL